MDLKTFVSETLKQIVEGVADAQTAIQEMGTGAAVNPATIYTSEEHARPSPVEFDVAVVAVEEARSEEGEKAKASASFISVLSLRAAGEIESARNIATKSEVASRIKFTVQLTQPGAVRRATPNYQVHRPKVV